MEKSSADWQIDGLRNINRLMYGVSLLGILDTVHLYVQNQFGFNKGCLGFIDSAIERSFNCQQVVSSEAGNLLGVSNTIIGISFFTLFAAFLLLRTYNFSPLHTKINKTGGYILAPAFLYVIYLFYYQYAVLEEYCLLCLISAGLVTLLFLLEITRQILLRKQQNRSANFSTSLRNETRYRLIFGLIVAILSVSDLMIASSQYQDQAESTDEKFSSYQADSLVLNNIQLRSLPGGPSQDCAYIDTANASNINLISFYDPIIGSSTPSTSIVFYLDPYQTESKEIYKILQKSLETWPEKLEIAFKPVAASKPAISGVKALYTAEQNGKFIPFLETLWNSSDNSGKNYHAPDLKQVAEKVELDGDKLLKDVDSNTLNSRLFVEKDKAIAAGLTKLPTVLINGKQVAHSSLTERCLKELIKYTF